MSGARLGLILAAGVVLAVGVYFLIGFACRYGVLATIMTGRISLLGVAAWLPYRTILAIDVAVMLYALYAWMQMQGIARRDAKPFANPLLLVIAGAGIAVIGFLSMTYPCPVPIDLWLLVNLEIPMFGVFIPYWIVLAVASCLLLYAVYVFKTQRREADGS